MSVDNSRVAAILNKMADLLDIQGANPFRTRAYRNAARVIQDLRQSVAELVEAGEDLDRLPGIGRDLASKIEEIARTGSLSELDAMEAKFPHSLTQLMDVPGLGPRRVRALYQALGVTDIDSLAQAARAGKVRGLAGFGRSTEERILAEIDRIKGRGDRRLKLIEAESVAERLLRHLRAMDGVAAVEAVGSYRRRQETVGDLDILIAFTPATDPDLIIDRFAGYSEIDRVTAKGETRSTALLHTGLQIDLWLVPQESYGAALHAFTGSQAHAIAVRRLALERGLKVNEYGVFKDDTRIAGETEAEVYETLGLEYIEPELREDRGEIEAALQHRLPKLVTLDDIKGDLHAHTTATDGRSSLEEMARSARARGYEYLAITDHSQRLTVARGQDAKRLARQIETIDSLNRELDGFVVLKSAEVDILEDGSLDLPDEILKRLDLVVCAIHHKFQMPREQQTERIIRAMEHPYFMVLAHPTGRRINRREPYEVDMERLMRAAKQTGCVLEVNAQPERMDLNDTYCRMAKDMDIMVAISTDAHDTIELNNMRFGVWQARRGWLEPENVLNTCSIGDLRALLRRKQRSSA